MGTYTLAGQGNDGSRYTGTATLSKIGGSMYGASWAIGANTFIGVCFRDTGTLACAWSVKPKDANVISYLIDKASDTLDGVWFGDGDTKLGTENLKPGGRLRPDLVGSYTIATGTNPDGSHYTGSVKITSLPVVCPSCYTLAWTLGTATVSGVGLLAPGNEPILAAGFADGAATYGALQYQISGKVLTGTWIQSINGSFSAGRETATRP